VNAPAASDQPPAPLQAETVTGDALASLVLPDTAAVSPAAPVEQAASSAIAPAASSYPPDALGRVFDPAKFRTKSKTDPAPFLNARGLFMPRGGRKPGRATATATETAPRVVHLPPKPEAPKPAETAATPQGAAVPPAPQPPPVARTAIEQTAEAYLRTGYVAADALFQSGKEWQPDDAAEHAALKEPLVEYLAISGAQPLPPWARFAVAVVAFAAKRFGRPNTAKAASGWWSKVNGAKPVAAAQPARTATTQQPAQPRPASVLEIEPLRV